MNLTSENLNGRVAVVTGANGGLGQSIALHLAAMGATVVRTDLSESGMPGNVPATGFFVACDITEETSVKSAAQVVSEKLGRCDILVNNAGILLPAVPLEEMPVETWDRVFNVNTRGTFLCAKHFGTLMLEQQSGSIVNFASIAASIPNQLSPYGPSKAAVLAFSRQLAVEWGPRGIRVNTVSPGLVRTPMSENYYQNERIHTARKSAVALRRIGNPEDIAKVVGFLSGDASSYVSGQEIVVDGGFLLTSLVKLQNVSGDKD